MLPTKIHFFDALKLAAAFALVYVVLQLMVTLTDVILVFFTALILAIAMDRPISRLEERNIPRSVSALVLYISVFFSIILMLYIVIPSLVTEIRIFVTEYSNYSEVLPLADEVSQFDVSPYLKSVSDTLAGSSGAFFSAVFKTVGSFTSFLAIFFVALFLTLQKGGLRSFLEPFLTDQYRQPVMHFFNNMQDRVSSWLWGKTLSSLIVGLITYIGLLLIGIPYALTLGVFAVFLNYIPFIGPVIAAIPAVVLGLTGFGLPTAAVVILLYFLINGILETFVLSPLLMKRAVEINPAFLILSAMSGAYIGGVLGIIIAIPVSAIIYLAMTEYLIFRDRALQKES